ncbi:MAG TPA: cytochrome c [Pelomicrobium sp.]|nr:cytochrome c [Pelomicrobium sp.]
MPALGLALALVAAAAAAADIVRGREIYAIHCASCHGSNGYPVVPGAPDFTRPDALMRPDNVLVQAVRFGRRAMPGYQGLLRDQEMYDVVAYLRTLR